MTLCILAMTHTAFTHGKVIVTLLLQCHLTCEITHPLGWIENDSPVLAVDFGLQSSLLL
jgi:hypothetical protein